MFILIQFFSEASRWQNKWNIMPLWFRMIIFNSISQVLFCISLDIMQYAISIQLKAECTLRGWGLKVFFFGRRHRECRNAPWEMREGLYGSTLRTMTCGTSPFFLFVWWFRPRNISWCGGVKCLRYFRIDPSMAYNQHPFVKCKNLVFLIVVVYRRLGPIQGFMSRILSLHRCTCTSDTNT